MKKGRQNIWLGVAAAAAALLAVFGFASTVKCEDTLKLILIIICSSLLIILAFLYITVIALSKENEPNFFLYDVKSGRNISPEELTFEMIDCRLNDYIAGELGGMNTLLHDRVLIDDTKFGAGCILRPLVAYKLLYDMASGSADLASLVTSAEPAYRVLCNALGNAGENDMPAVLQKYRAGAVDADGFARYLSNNKKYLQSRMISFVRRNMERFY